MGGNRGLLWFAAVLLCMVVVMSGCARKHVISASNQDGGGKSVRLTKADMKYQNIQIVKFFISPKGVQETDDAEKMLAQAQAACTEALQESNLFETVRTVSDPGKVTSTLLVQGELTKLKIIGGGMRFAAGPFAGKSEMSIYIKLIDAATGTVVVEKEVRNDSNPILGDITIGGSDKALPKQTGNLVADLVAYSAKK